MAASAALICACVPDSVRLALALAPALMVAPPARLTLSVPLPTLTLTVARLPCGSTTDTPLITRVVSSLTDCAPGTVLTGGPLQTTVAENSEVSP